MQEALGPTGLESTGLGGALAARVEGGGEWSVWEASVALRGRRREA